MSLIDTIIESLVYYYEKKINSKHQDDFFAILDDLLSKLSNFTKKNLTQFDNTLKETLKTMNVSPQDILQLIESESKLTVATKRNEIDENIQALFINNILASLSHYYENELNGMSINIPEQLKQIQIENRDSFAKALEEKLKRTNTPSQDILELIKSYSKYTSPTLHHDLIHWVEQRFMDKYPDQGRQTNLLPVIINTAKQHLRPDNLLNLLKDINQIHPLDFYTLEMLVSIEAHATANLKDNPHIVNYTKFLNQMMAYKTALKLPNPVIDKAMLHLCKKNDASFIHALKHIEAMWGLNADDFETLASSDPSLTLQSLIQQHPESFIYALNHQLIGLEDIPCALRNEPEFIYNWLTNTDDEKLRSHRFLTFCPNELKNDAEFMFLVAKTININVLEQASAELIANPQFMLTLVKTKNVTYVKANTLAPKIITEREPYSKVIYYTHNNFKANKAFLNEVYAPFAPSNEHPIEKTSITVVYSSYDLLLSAKKMIKPCDVSRYLQKKLTDDLAFMIELIKTEKNTSICVGMDVNDNPEFILTKIQYGAPQSNNTPLHIFLASLMSEIPEHLRQDPTFMSRATDLVNQRSLEKPLSIDNLPTYSYFGGFRLKKVLRTNKQQENDNQTEVSLPIEMQDHSTNNLSPLKTSLL